MSNHTPDEIRTQRNIIEFLVCRIIRHTENTSGIRLSGWPDGELAERNAMVRRCWEELDRLSLWAGGGTAGWLAPGGTDHDRGQFTATCNRLHAEVEPGAHVAEIAITVHTADGTEISYHTAPGTDETSAIVHTANHDGCVQITTEDNGS